MREMKDSGIEWIGEIPNNFGVQRIKNCVTERFGGCWGEDETEGNSHLCIRIADFDFNTQSVKDTASTMRSYTATQLANGMLKDGDIIIEKSGGGEKTPVGRTVLYSFQTHPYAMFANFCDVLRPTQNINNKYMAYCLKALYQNVDMHLFFNQTTGLQNLNMGKYLNAKIPFPKLSEQTTIVSFLDAKCAEIDSLTTDIQSQIDTLEQYKRSVITEAVTKGLNPDVEMKDSGIEWAQKIPKHWKIMQNKYVMHKVKEICPLYKNEDILSLTMNGVIVRDLDAGGKMPASFNGYQKLYPGNLLMCLFDYDVTPRTVGVIQNEGLTSPAYSQFVMDEGNSPDYYYYYYLMLDYTKELLHLAKNLRHSFTEEQLGQINTPVPPTQEQVKIALYLDDKCREIDDLIDVKKNQLEVLDEYKKSLIYEYVTGKKEL